MKAAWSIGRWPLAALLVSGLSAACGGPVANGPKPAPPSPLPSTAEAAPESRACSEVRAMVCDSGLRPVEASQEPSVCGTEADLLIGDLQACLPSRGAPCDEAARAALQGLRDCGERLLVRETASGGTAATQQARQFVEQWIESRQAWLAVGPLGLVPAPGLVRALAASALRRGDRASAAAWLDATAGVDADALAVEACTWAVNAPDLGSVPLELDGVATVASASLAWGGCAGR